MSINGNDIFQFPDNYASGHTEEVIFISITIVSRKHFYSPDMDNKIRCSWNNVLVTNFIEQHRINDTCMLFVIFVTSYIFIIFYTPSSSFSRHSLIARCLLYNLTLSRRATHQFVAEDLVMLTSLLSIQIHQCIPFDFFNSLQATISYRHLHILFSPSSINSSHENWFSRKPEIVTESRYIIDTTCIVMTVAKINI